MSVIVLAPLYCNQRGLVNLSCIKKTHRFSYLNRMHSLTLVMLWRLNHSFAFLGFLSRLSFSFSASLIWREATFMNKKSFALVSGLVVTATSFLMPISANSVDIHQVSTQDTPQLLAQGRGRGRERSLQNPTPCPNNPCPNPGSNTQVTLSNGYRITFLGVTYGSGTSTWRYRMEELPVAQDLSNWVLGLPSCNSVVSASPKAELVNPDPNAQISGIKWQPGGGFVQGEFSVTLNRQVSVAVVDVAAKGPDVVRGTIAGPSCDLR